MADGTGHRMAMGWGRFAGMIGVSTVIMFLLMYQLVYSAEHATFSINRLLSALIMAGVMTAVMLLFMWDMYQPRMAKILVLGGALVLAALLVALNRAQTLVDDRRFMKSMIPHHSIAINNARKASISDPRVRDLADTIISSQVREIAEMKALIADIEANGERGREPLPALQAEITPDMLSRVGQAVE